MMGNNYADGENVGNKWEPTKLRYLFKCPYCGEVWSGLRMFGYNFCPSCGKEVKGVQNEKV